MIGIEEEPLTGTYVLSIDGNIMGALLNSRYERLIECGKTATVEGVTAVRLAFYITEGKQYSLKNIKVMLNAGSSALPWEPYTGGKPSPSPNYPQEIKNAKSEVVVHGKNLFGG